MSKHTATGRPEGGFGGRPGLEARDGGSKHNNVVHQTWLEKRRDVGGGVCVNRGEVFEWSKEGLRKREQGNRVFEDLWGHPREYMGAGAPSNAHKGKGGTKQVFSTGKKKVPTGKPKKRKKERQETSMVQSANPKKK